MPSQPTALDNTADRVRVGIDWDNDGFVNWGAREGDPLNYLTGAPRHDAMGGTVRAGGAGGYYVDKVNYQSWTHDLTDKSYYNGNIDWTGFRIFNVKLYATEEMVLGRKLSDPQNKMCSAFKVTFASTSPLRVTAWVRSVVDATISLGMNYTLTSSATPPVGAISYTSKTVKANTWIPITYSPGSVAAGTYYINFWIKTNAVFQDTYVTGLMLTPTATPVRYNPGRSATNLYDNISNRVRSLDSFVGNKDTKDRLSKDGSATLEVDNNDNLFTPRKSILYAHGVQAELLAHKRIQVQIRDTAVNNRWITVWAGDIDNIDPIISGYRDKVAQIECSYKLFPLKNSRFYYDEDDLAADPVKTWRTDQVLLMLFRRNSWISPTTRGMFRLGVSRLAMETYLLHTDPNMGFFGAGDVNDLKYIGYKWDDMDFATAVRATVESEHGWLFMLRNGTIAFYARWLFRDTSMINTQLDTKDAQDVRFEYGNDIRNDVTVPYRFTYRGGADIIPEPRSATDADDDLEDDQYKYGHLWGKKKNIAAWTHKNMKRTIKQLAVWTVPTTPQDNTLQVGGIWDVVREYGLGNTPDFATLYDWDANSMKIISIYPGLLVPAANNAWDVPATNSLIIGLASNVEPIPDLTTHYFFYQENPANPAGNAGWQPNWRVKDGNNIKLRFYNSPAGGVGFGSTFTVRPIAVRGLVNIMGEEEYYKAGDRASILQHDKRYGYSVKKTLFINEAQAASLAQQLLDDYKYSNNGYIREFKVISGKDSDRGAYIIGTMDIGRYTAIRDTTSGMTASINAFGNTGAPHLCIGQQLKIRGTTIEATYYFVGTENMT